MIKQIAMKKMSEKEKKQTELESILLGKLSHPNIVTYWESFVDNNSGKFCIVMEFADGGDIDSYIKSRKGRYFPEAEVLRIFVQICLAIKHIHDRKILHRDLKGQNIFLTANGIVKVGDFGIARVLRNTGEFAATRIGTPYYMSPEIMDGKRYNSKTDIWSLGVILFELMCLKLPFDGRSMQDLVRAVVHSPPPQVRTNKAHRTMQYGKRLYGFAI